MGRRRTPPCERRSRPPEDRVRCGNAAWAASAARSVGVPRSGARRPRGPCGIHRAAPRRSLERGRRVGDLDQGLLARARPSRLTGSSVACCASSSPPVSSVGQHRPERIVF
jgi:hypothetical protein